ncbi:hypothetical protein P7C73_g2800, partial [Tremellales sp. Uapishka_1]
MSTIHEFIAAAERAEPSLAGSSEQDKVEISKLATEAESWVGDLKSLNDRLNPLTYLHANSPSTADVSLYCHLHPSMINAPPAQHPTHPSILRYFLQIQSLPPVITAHAQLPNSFPTLSVNVDTLPAPERQVIAPKPKKEKKAAAPAAAAATAPSAAEATAVLGSSIVEGVAAAASSIGGTLASAAEAVKGAVTGAAPAEVSEGGKKEKKDKKEKKPKAPAAVKEEPTGPLPSMIDMRVGKVLDVNKHPDAESLYVETIDIGEETGPRTVCSGLVKYMSEDDIRGATVIVICNLKPVTMRGVKSFAMLLCASSAGGKEAGGVEFVLPPAGAQPGDRIYFEGEKYENAQPEAQLNPKKKVFETIQPGFITLDTREAAWVDPETKSVHKIRTKDGVCKAKSFVGASLS